jgi:hypothetical protein
MLSTKYAPSGVPTLVQRELGANGNYSALFSSSHRGQSFGFFLRVLCGIPEQLTPMPKSCGLTV